MDNTNLELQETEVKKGDKYQVHIKFDKEVIKAFFKFYNKVKHPRATFFMLVTGAMLTALPIVNHDIKLPGVIVCFIMGPVLVLFGLFRQHISVAMMKDNPEMGENEDLVYRFTNTGVMLDKRGKSEHMGSYSKIYRIWEDEKHFYVGMNEDDLLVLPKNKFEIGEAATFRDFIVEKSNCVYTWSPARIDNSIKWKMEQLKNREWGAQFDFNKFKKNKKK